MKRNVKLPEKNVSATGRDGYNYEDLFKIIVKKMEMMEIVLVLRLFVCTRSVVKASPGAIALVIMFFLCVYNIMVLVGLPFLCRE